MQTTSKCLIGIALLASPAWAHFPFIVPEPELQGARVLLSETLELDTQVAADLVLAGTYRARLRDGSERALEVRASSDGAFVELQDELTRANLLFGTLDLGFTQRGDGTPHLLVYHAKTLQGDAFDPAAHVEGVPIEITPVRAGDGFQLLLSVDGAPEPDTAIVVIQPDGTEREVVTGADGRTELMRSTGQYGAWARHWIEQPGERDGKSYEQVRRYATLVFDYDEPAAVAQKKRPSGGHGFAPEPTPILAASSLNVSLPEATSSFGAVQQDGWVYVYGGHIAPTHSYDTEAVSGSFWRIDLTGNGAWEQLPGGAKVQGMNLAAHDGLVYRVGGMEPRNAPGAEVDNWSLSLVERFDPGTRDWEELPPMPAGRSSHDVAIVDGSLYVIGGWDMAGAAGNTWPATMLVLDLTDPSATWVELPQPFKRRALIVAVQDHRIFAIGGFDPYGEPSRRVDVFDTREGRWSQGPGLPGGAMNGFSPAACAHDRQLYVSLGDGTIHRLDNRDFRWEQVGTSTRRIVHRMLSLGGRILILGGASKGGNHDLIEEFSPAPRRTAEAAGAQRMRASANERLALAHGQAASPVAHAQPAVATAQAVALPQVTPAPESYPKPEDAPATAPGLAPTPAAIAAAAVQSHCPIMTDEPVDETSYTVEHEGRTVLLCCKSCVRKWDRNPGHYAGSVLLPQLAETARAPAVSSGH